MQQKQEGVLYSIILMELPRDNVLEEVAMQRCNVAWATGQ